MSIPDIPYDVANRKVSAILDDECIYTALPPKGIAAVVASTNVNRITAMSQMAAEVIVNNNDDVLILKYDGYGKSTKAHVLATIANMFHRKEDGEKFRSYDVQAFMDGKESATLKPIDVERIRVAVEKFGPHISVIDCSKGGYMKLREPEHIEPFLHHGKDTRTEKMQAMPVLFVDGVQVEGINVEGVLQRVLNCCKPLEMTAVVTITRTAKETEQSLLSMGSAALGRYIVDKTGTYVLSSPCVGLVWQNQAHFKKVARELLHPAQARNARTREQRESESQPVEKCLDEMTEQFEAQQDLRKSAAVDERWLKDEQMKKRYREKHNESYYISSLSLNESPIAEDEVTDIALTAIEDASIRYVKFPPFTAAFDCGLGIETARIAAEFIRRGIPVLIYDASHKGMDMQDAVLMHIVNLESGKRLIGTGYFPQLMAGVEIPRELEQQVDYHLSGKRKMMHVMEGDDVDEAIEWFRINRKDCFDEKPAFIICCADRLMKNNEVSPLEIAEQLEEFSRNGNHVVAGLTYDYWQRPDRTAYEFVIQSHCVLVPERQRWAILKSVCEPRDEVGGAVFEYLANMCGVPIDVNMFEPEHIGCFMDWD